MLKQCSHHWPAQKEKSPKLSSNKCFSMAAMKLQWHVKGILKQFSWTGLDNLGMEATTEAILSHKNFSCVCSVKRVVHNQMLPSHTVVFMLNLHTLMAMYHPMTQVFKAEQAWELNRLVGKAADQWSVQAILTRHSFAPHHKPRTWSTVTPYRAEISFQPYNHTRLIAIPAFHLNQESCSSPV